MLQNRLLFRVSLVLFIAAAYLLISGSPVLTWSVSDHLQLPLGTLTTWVGFIAFTLTILTGVLPNTKPHNRFYWFLSKVLLLNLLVAILWVPISFLLSGTLSFTFGQRIGFQGGQLAMKLFWGMNYCLVAIPLLVLLLHWGYVLFNRLKIQRNVPK
ncbi:MAG: hypothetical protein P1U56_24925 [Saprospiraceae bacterium]|nr:hypothetical protein [Saprospiraceae bacterium]